MCELFAMSSQAPAALSYSLNEFAKHGGLTHKNKSGWGIAYYEDREAFMVKEALPASDSPLAHFIASQNRKSNCVIAHVRLATVGTPTLKNTHPFRRELGGRVHIFAHNGTLKGIHEDYANEELRYNCIGDTDSELGFCVLLERMRPLWANSDDIPPSHEARLEAFALFAGEMRERGSANFLYSDGDILFVHAHRRIYEENGGFSDPRAPGLSIRNCTHCQQEPEYSCDGLNLNFENKTTTLLASVPLDKQGWEPLPEGVAIAIRDGIEIGRILT